MFHSRHFRNKHSHRINYWVFSHSSKFNLTFAYPLSPSSACRCSLGQSTSFPWSPDRAFGLQRWWQSASSMYTKPQWSHDLLYTCSLQQLVGGNIHSTPFFQPLSGQAKVKKEIFLLRFHVSTVQCWCNSARAISTIYFIHKPWLFCYYLRFLLPCQVAKHLN